MKDDPITDALERLSQEATDLAFLRQSKEEEISQIDIRLHQITGAIKELQQLKDYS